MPVINRNDVMNTATMMNLKLHHFARGTYPEAQGQRDALPLNRFFIPVSNPDGEACYIEDGEQHFTLCQGRAYFIPCFHKAGVKLSPELQFISIQFRLELYAGIDLFSRTKTIREINDSTFLADAEEAFQTEDLMLSAVMLRSVTERFAMFQLSMTSAKELENLSLFSKFQKEIDYIHAHADASTTIEELARISGVRREVFSRNFTHAAGISPKQFLNQFLLNKACDFLRNGKMARETAFELGFSNEFYFSRFFTKHIGIPPHKFQLQYVYQKNRQQIVLIHET